MHRGDCPNGATEGHLVPASRVVRRTQIRISARTAAVCYTRVSSLPQDQQHVRDFVRVLHTAVHVGCPAEDMRSGRSAPFVLPEETGISPDVVHLMGYRRGREGEGHGQ